MPHEWIQSTLDDVAIGASAVLLIASFGRIAGGLLLLPDAGGGDRGRRLAFVTGLAAAPLPGLLLWREAGIGAPQVSWPRMYKERA